MHRPIVYDLFFKCRPPPKSKTDF